MIIRATADRSTVFDSSKKRNMWRSPNSASSGQRNGSSMGRDARNWLFEPSCVNRLLNAVIWSTCPSKSARYATSASVSANTDDGSMINVPPIGLQPVSDELEYGAMKKSW